MNILNTRKSGVLFHISSLPGETGIGTMGRYAYEFVDLLSNAKQTYWQMLPICPTSYGDSPYQSFSTFAGNPYFIDFEILKNQGYLSEADYQNISWGKSKTSVDYGKLYINRRKVFKKLYKNFCTQKPEDFYGFCNENTFWLEDYALFMALKDANNGAAFSTWVQELRCRNPEALEQVKNQLKDEIEYYKMLQYFFFKQWYDLKAYANSKGIKIIGDIPIYVAGDSADVWASPALFKLDENLNPIDVAGCPPDGFSATGQLWGNPVYNWEYHKNTNYEWWKKRLSQSLRTYDVLRIDHFRGFDSFYAIPFGSNTAQNGRWEQGPGIDLFNNVKQEMGEIPIIAEDLGFLTDSVKQLLKDSGFPGMKVLQFAFDSREESDYLPFRYHRNSIVYTGTHDNETIIGWSKNAGENDIRNAMEYYGLSKPEQIRTAMMLSAMESVSNTCILTMQDLIGLGSAARMNTPSTQGNNWKWRATYAQMTKVDYAKLKQYTELYGRY